mgnify:FL=1
MKKVPVKKNLHNHRKHNQYKFKKIFWLFLLLLLILGVGVAGIAYRNIYRATTIVYKKANAHKERNAGKLIDNKRPISILLLGTDTGALGRKYKGRTDTMIIMSINPQKQKTVMMSLPRDMKVNLSGYSEYSPAKINAAYTYGGTKESIDTVQKYLKVPIDYYVLVNMGGLKKAINQVGGVTVVSPLTFTYLGDHFVKGKKYHLYGNDALKFSRMRYSDPQGDYGRQLRQRLILTGLLKKSFSYKTFLSSSFLKSISNQAQTDLNRSQMFGLSLNYRKVGNHVVSDHVQGVGKEIGGQDFEVVSKSELIKSSNIIRNNLGLTRY